MIISAFNDVKTSGSQGDRGKALLADQEGRVEWVFKTLQDRLVKEMRIAGVKSLQEANRFLAGYLGTFNRRFMKEALKPGGLHRPLPKSVVLDDVLCIKGVRTVNEGYLV